MQTHPATQPMLELVDVLRAAVARAEATIESFPDPTYPGRTAYRITGPSKACVQAAIDDLMRRVDLAFGGVGGFAQFTNPARADGGYGSRGEVIPSPVR